MVKAKKKPYEFPTADRRLFHGPAGVFHGILPIPDKRHSARVQAQATLRLTEEQRKAWIKKHVDPVLDFLEDLDWQRKHWFLEEFSRRVCVHCGSPGGTLCCTCQMDD